MSELIPVPTVDLLVKELKAVTNWYVFGVSLHIPIRQLERIKLDNANEGLEKQKTIMFHFWLQFNANASWKEIVQALEQNDQFTLAENVKKKYVLHVSNSAGTSQDQDGQQSIDSEMEVEIRAAAGVVERLQDLESSFATMLTNLPILLLECKCDLSLAKSFLNNLIFTEKFSQSNSFDELLQQLRRDHMDTFNVYFLEKLLDFLKEKVKSEEMKTKLTEHIKQYKQKKEEFVNNTLVIDFHRAVLCKTNPTELKRKTKLKIKISDEFATERTLKDVERLARKAFDESDRSLVCMHAEVGSVIITWFFPENQSGEFETLAIESATVFKDAGVEEVTVGGRVVFPSTLESKESLRISSKKIYTDFYHRLVEAVSDEHTCQSLLTQLSSSALISEEKIAQLSSSKVTGSSFLKTLGLEEESHLLVPLVSAMSRVEKLQTLAEEMFAVLRQDQGFLVKKKELFDMVVPDDSGDSKQFGAVFKSHKTRQSCKHMKVPEEAPSKMDFVQYENAEYNTFQLHYADLYESFHNPVALTERLHSAGLLSIITRQRIFTRALGDSESLFDILDAMETAIRLDPRNFYTCLSILEEDSSMQHLWNKMRLSCGLPKLHTPQMVPSVPPNTPAVVGELSLSPLPPPRKAAKLADDIAAPSFTSKIPPTKLKIPAPTVTVGWKRVGKVLGIPLKKLNSIELDDPNGGVENWKLKMFQFWLQYKPDASWTNVVIALRNTDMEHSIAVILNRKYLLPDETLVEVQIEIDEVFLDKLCDLATSFTELQLDFAKYQCDFSRAKLFLNSLLNTEEFSQCVTFIELMRQLCSVYVTPTIFSNL